MPASDVDDEAGSGLAPVRSGVQCQSSLFFPCKKHHIGWVAHFVVPPFMTRLRCSVESSNDTANILRGCEMTCGLTMAREWQFGSVMLVQG